MPTEPVVLSRQDFDDLQKLLGFHAEPAYDEGYIEAHHDGTTYRAPITDLEGRP